MYYIYDELLFKLLIYIDIIKMAESEGNIVIKDGIHKTYSGYADDY